MICDTCVRRDRCISGPKPGEIIVSCGAYKKPPTNADRIRAMSDEELAGMLNQAGTDGRAYGPIGEAAWLDWLKREVYSDPT